MARRVSFVVLALPCLHVCIQIKAARKAADDDNDGDDNNNNKNNNMQGFPFEMFRKQHKIMRGPQN